MRLRTASSRECCVEHARIIEGGFRCTCPHHPLDGSVPLYMPSMMFLFCFLMARRLSSPVTSSISPVIVEKIFIEMDKSAELVLREPWTSRWKDQVSSLVCIGYRLICAPWIFRILEVGTAFLTVSQEAHRTGDWSRCYHHTAVQRGQRGAMSGQVDGSARTRSASSASSPGTRPYFGFPARSPSSYHSPPPAPPPANASVLSPSETGCTGSAGSACAQESSRPDARPPAGCTEAQARRSEEGCSTDEGTYQKALALDVQDAGRERRTIAEQQAMAVEQDADFIRRARQHLRARAQEQKLHKLGERKAGEGGCVHADALAAIEEARERRCRQDTNEQTAHGQRVQMRLQEDATLEQQLERLSDKREDLLNQVLPAAPDKLCLARDGHQAQTSVPARSGSWPKEEEKNEIIADSVAAELQTRENVFPRAPADAPGNVLPSVVTHRVHTVRQTIGTTRTCWDSSAPCPSGSEVVSSTGKHVTEHAPEGPPTVDAKIAANAAAESATEKSEETPLQLACTHETQVHSLDVATFACVCVCVCV